MVELVGFLFTCSIGNQRFPVGLVDQLFQPTQNPVELVEKDGYRPLSQSWALIRCVMSTNKMVGVWCPLSPGIRRETLMWQSDLRHLLKQWAVKLAIPLIACLKVLTCIYFPLKTSKGNIELERLEQLRGNVELERQKWQRLMHGEGIEHQRIRIAI